MPTEIERVLFLFAHPDDEFFCTAFLAAETAAGHEVHCAYLTDGAWGGQSAQRRVDEATRVLARFTVPSSRIHFIGMREAIPDGGLPKHMRKAFDALDVLAKPSFARIYTTAWEGGHQDHDACHAIALKLASMASKTEVLQFSLYNAFHVSAPWFRVMAPIPANGSHREQPMSIADILRSLSIALAYPSQWKTWMGLLPFAAWSLFSRRRMICQPATMRRLAERPHDGTLLYERRGHATYRQVNEDIVGFLEQPHSNDS